MVPTHAGASLLLLAVAQGEGISGCFFSLKGVTLLKHTNTRA